MGVGGTYRLRRGEFGSYTAWLTSEDIHLTLRTLGFTRDQNTTPIMDMAVESLFTRGSIQLTRAMVKRIVKNLGKNKVGTLVYSRIKTGKNTWTVPAKIAKDPKVYDFLADLMSHEKKYN